MGVDMVPGVANSARQTGIYRAVHTTRANRLPFPPETFASAFADRSLEHLDDLAGVLSSIQPSLRPEGSLLLSVVSVDELIPIVLEMAGRSSLVNRKRTGLPGLQSSSNLERLWD
ncbi:MAG: methyltransferase domain-containing protein [Syntrophobacteraceae bacterium]